MNQRDGSVEAAIVAKGLTAPRITPDMIDANIKSEAYHVFDGSCLTVCCLTLQNGFTVTGESACASPENFDAEIGRKIARENAINKVWPLMGYALKERLTGLQPADVADAKASGFRDGYTSAKRGDPAPLSNGGDDFELPAKACDLSGEGTCEACQ